jgi:hypothetical protein
MGENEKLPEEPEEEEEYEEDEEDEEEEEHDGIPEFDEESHALWVFRKTFQMLDDNDSIIPNGRAEPVEDLYELRWRAMRTARRRPIDDGYATA